MVDGQRHVIGFISDGDIMRAVAKQKTRTVFGGVDSAMVVYDTQSFADKVRALQKRGVMELASKKVFCVSPEQPVDEVARILAKQKLKKVPVVDKDGVLVGVVRRSTIMRYILNCLFAK